MSIGFPNIDAPVPRQRYRYTVRGRRRMDGSYGLESVWFESSQPRLEPGEVVGTGTVARDIPVIETRVDPETGVIENVHVCHFEPAGERYAFLDAGRVHAKLSTGEFSAEPLNDEDE